MTEHFIVPAYPQSLRLQTFLSPTTSIFAKTLPWPAQQRLKSDRTISTASRSADGTLKSWTLCQE